MNPIEWRKSPEPKCLIPQAVAAVEARVAAIRVGTDPELVWLLEHPALYTAGIGTGARGEGLLLPDFLPVFQTGRGGKLGTYHGPGPTHRLCDGGSRTMGEGAICGITSATSRRG